MDTKKFSIAETKAIDVENRTMEVIGSTATKDRSGDVIEVEGWDIKNFMENPVFLWSHDGRSVPPIGRALSVKKTTEGLKFKIEFAPKDVHPFADTIFQLFRLKFLRGVSVGFLPTEREIITDVKTGEFTGFRFKKQQLIELSAVSVPDNPEAVVMEAADFLSKSLDATSSFSKTLQELQKEILLMDKEPEVTATEIIVDKWQENVENRLKQLEVHTEVNTSVPEILQVVKTMLEGIKSGTSNPFLKVLAPGNAPEGSPEDSKALIEAIAKSTQRLSNWTLKTTK